MTFTATLTSSLPFFTVFFSLFTPQRVLKIAQFHSCTWYSARAFQGYQDGRHRLFLGGLFWGNCIFYSCPQCWVFIQPVSKETIDESVKIFVWTAVHCALGEITPWHALLQQAHLLIRHDPVGWLALLFSAQNIEICLSVKQTGTGSYSHARHPYKHSTFTQIPMFIMPLF